MFQDPVLNYGLSHSDGFFATECSTLHPFGKMVLHDNDIIIDLLGHFKWTHQIYRDSLVESPVGSNWPFPRTTALQLLQTVQCWHHDATSILHAGPVEPS